MIRKKLCAARDCDKRFELTRAWRSFCSTTCKVRELQKRRRERLKLKQKENQ
jgi:hypothetical protein